MEIMPMNQVRLDCIALRGSARRHETWKRSISAYGLYFMLRSNVVYKQFVIAAGFRILS